MANRAGACLRGGGQPKLCKAAVRCATRKPGGRKVTLYTRCGSCRAPSTGPSRRGMASAPLASDSVTAEQYGNSACCGFEKLLGLCSDLQALPCTAHTGPTLGPHWAYAYICRARPDGLAGRAAIRSSSRGKFVKGAEVERPHTLHDQLPYLIASLVECSRVWQRCSRRAPHLEPSPACKCK